MLFLRYCGPLRRIVLRPWSKCVASYGIRPLSSTATLPAAIPRNQQLARRRVRSTVRSEINAQEQVQTDYSPEDGNIMETLEELGMKNLRVAERLFRLHRSHLVREGVSPTSAAQLAKTSQKWKMDYEEQMSTTEVEIMTNHATLGELFYVAAMTDLSRTNQLTYWKLGTLSLQVAFELGYGDAAIEFAKVELRSGGLKQKGDPDALLKPVDLPTNILGYITRAAISRQDWRAMSLYLDYALRRQQNKATAENIYQIAVDLSTMAGPSLRTIDQVIPSERFELPWFLLQRAADEYYAHLPPDSSEAASVKRTYVDALNTGRDTWNDSRAAELLLRNTDEVKPGSSRWLELLTQAAMQGDPDFCFRLGDYHLRQEGWHPECLKRSPPTLRTSLWWIELSAYAMRHSPIWARQRYLLLAVLLRENGFAEEATSYLVRGQLALRETQTADAERSIKWLQNTIDEWDNPDWNMTSTRLLDAEPLYQQQRLRESRAAVR
jgi:hypothetical protein